MKIRRNQEKIELIMKKRPGFFKNPAFRFLFSARSNRQVSRGTGDRSGEKIVLTIKILVKFNDFTRILQIQSHFSP